MDDFLNGGGLLPQLENDKCLSWGDFHYIRRVADALQEVVRRLFFLPSPQCH
jgi:hypothetical protein